MTTVKHRKVNVICFWMLFSIAAFVAFSLIYDIVTDGIAVLLQPFAVRYITLAFNMICASLLIRFGDRNKNLYPIGATLGIVAAESFLLNKALNALVTADNSCEILISGLSFAALLLLIVTFALIVMKLTQKKPCDRLLSFFTIAYMLIILCIALINGFEKITIDGTSLGEAAMMTIQYFLLINAPLVVYVLVRQADVSFLRDAKE